MQNSEEIESLKGREREGRGRKEVQKSAGEKEGKKEEMGCSGLAPPFTKGNRRGADRV